MRWMTSRQARSCCRWAGAVCSDSRDGGGSNQSRAMQVGVSMKGDIDSKQRVTFATCKLNDPPTAMVLRGGSSKVPACTLRSGHTGGRQDQASWWHEQPQL